MGAQAAPRASAAFALGRAVIDVGAVTMAVIKTAVRRESGSKITPEDRFDLSQEIALRLSTRKTQPKNLQGWAREVARNLAHNLRRTRRREREALQQKHKLGELAPYRRRLEARDPLKNYMAVKAAHRGTGINKVENAMIAWVDGSKAPTAATCAQDMRALAALKVKLDAAARALEDKQALAQDLAAKIDAALFSLETSHYGARRLASFKAAKVLRYVLVRTPDTRLIPHAK